MSHAEPNVSNLPGQPGALEPEAGRPLPAVVQYGLTLAMVLAAAALAGIASQVVPPAGLTLVFVLPVVVAGAAFGWGPSLVAIAAGVLAFDFFFTQPVFTLRMTDPADAWAAGLLIVIAAIVGQVSWRSRQRAVEARRAAVQADALQGLAHLVISGAPQPKVVSAAAAALGRIFDGPAVILAQTGQGMRIEASAGTVRLSEAETEAAEAALASGPVRAETFPHEQSRFDFWPVPRSGAGGYVLGLDVSHSADGRPADPERFMEIVGAYLVGRRP